MHDPLRESPSSLEHIASARAQSERAGALPSLALTTLDEARALLARGRPEDQAQIRRLARDVLERAQQIASARIGEPLPPRRGRILSRPKRSRRRR
jgi:hexokinase